MTHARAVKAHIPIVTENEAHCQCGRWGITRGDETQGAFTDRAWREWQAHRDLPAVQVEMFDSGWLW